MSESNATADVPWDDYIIRYISFSVGRLCCSFRHFGQCEGLTQWSERRSIGSTFFFVCVGIKNYRTSAVGAKQIIVNELYMAELKFPVTELEKDKFQVVVDMALYAKESLVAACYKFTDNFYVHQQTADKTIVVIFESKDGSVISDETVKKFCNELVDQQVRYNTNQQFGHIRDLIVEEAFKPVSK